MASSTFRVPTCVEPECDQVRYARWLHRKAQAHVRRDRKRDMGCTVAKYKADIHRAVCDSDGKDFYTGELLDWSLVSKWDNETAKRERVKYKKSLAMLPTVDHTFDEQGRPIFVICSWYVNDAKSDLTLPEFYALCECILQHRTRKSKAAAGSSFIS